MQNETYGNYISPFCYDQPQDFQSFLPVTLRSAQVLMLFHSQGSFSSNCCLSVFIPD